MTISDESIPVGVEAHVCINKEELAELRQKAAMYELIKPKQWNPPGGPFSLYGSGLIVDENYPDYNDFGMEFKSMEQAKEARPLIRTNNRLIQYVLEHGGIQKFEQGLNNWTVTSQAEVINYQDTPLTNTIFMSLICAKSLAAGMKDKSIIL